MRVCTAGTEPYLQPSRPTFSLQDMSVRTERSRLEAASTSLNCTSSFERAVAHAYILSSRTRS